jgi:hypothetical protein
MPAFPTQNIDQFYMTIYGGYGYDGCDVGGFGIPGWCQCNAFLGLASGVPTGTNPPYTVNDFLGIYPKFFGAPTLISATLTSGSPIITVDSTATGLSSGQLVTCQGLNDGTVIKIVIMPEITVSSNATASGVVTLAVYEAQLVPLAVMQLYLNIAIVSIMQSRWREQWELGMDLYIAHYLTLYCQTEGNQQSTANQIVANSLQAGVTISQGADGVSQGLQAIKAVDNWASWSLTQYGVQLASLARVVGSGPAYFRR